MLTSALLIFILDGLVLFLNIKEREAWATGDIRRSLVIEGVTAAAGVANVLLVVDYSWPMMAPSVLGVLVGRWLAWRY
jgi:hypothetical protein